MYTSYSTLQRKQLTKQVYTDTQSTYLLVYAPGRHQALEHALENQLHRKFRLVTELAPALTDSVEGVLLVSEDLECTSTALTYFAGALRTGADLVVCDAAFGFDGSTALYLSTQHIPCSRCAMVSRKLLDRIRAAARGDPCRHPPQLLFAEAAAFPKLAQQKDDAVIIDVLIHIGTSFLNFALRHKYEDRPGRYPCIREMFFVLLRADRYAGILEANGGFELFPINGPPQLQRFLRLLFAGRRYARRRSSASKGKLQKACNDHGSAHNDHIGGSWRHQAENQRQKAQRQQEHAINAVAHCPPFAHRAFRGVSADAGDRRPHRGQCAPSAVQCPPSRLRCCGRYRCTRGKQSAVRSDARR